MDKLSSFRFFGTEATHGTVTFSRYGQVIQLDPAAAEAMIAADPPALLLPEEQWQEVGFTEAELAEYPSAKIHSLAPDEFRAKAKSVRMASDAYRAGLRAAS